MHPSIRASTSRFEMEASLISEREIAQPATDKEIDEDRIGARSLWVEDLGL
jgi:hypothetical protein